MTRKEFKKNRKLVVNVEGQVLEYNSIPDMLPDFHDLKNKETWASAFKFEDGTAGVFICDRFDWTGKLIERNMSPEEAINHAENLNKYYAICEEYSVEQL